MAVTRTVDFSALPATAETILGWTWDDYEPYFADLLARDLTQATADRWLRDLTHLLELLQEQGAPAKRLQPRYARAGSPAPA